jgi:hypothetical protein
MCTYQHKNSTLECRGDGYMWDADHDSYDPDDLSMPCPECNTEAYLLEAKEDAESCSHGSANGYVYTGESIWLGAVRVAEAANDPVAKAVLLKIGVVDALLPDAGHADGFVTRTYVYK